MTDNNELRLFGGDSLIGFLDARLASARTLAERITQVQFLALGPGALEKPIYDELSVAPIALQLEQMQRQERRIEIAKVMPVDDYGKRLIREVMVPGYMMLYLIPFTGDPQLWLLNHGPWLVRSGGRDALDAEQRILTLTLHNTSDVESNWYQRTMEKTMKEFDRYLDHQALTLKQYHLDLAEAVARAVARRGRQLQASGA